MRRRLLTALAALAFAAPSLAAPGAAAHDAASATKRPGWPTDAVPGSLLVTTDSPSQAAALARRTGGTPLGRVVHLRVGAGREPARAAALDAEPGVVAVEPDRHRRPLRLPDDTRFPEQWSHGVAGAPGAWDVTTGAGAVIAVIDSGVDGGHPDLRPNLVEQVAVTGGAVVARPLGVDNDRCDIGHGTAVAGVAAARGDNGTGVAGVAMGASLVDVSLVGGDDGDCTAFTDAAVLAALDHVVRRPGGPVDVANLSFGSLGDSCPTAYQAVIDAAVAAGVVVVAAAGNEQAELPGATSVPASCRNVVSVGAVARNRAVASYSDANPWVDLVAPGGDPAVDGGILSTASGGGYDAHHGTSFAAPYVAGVAALLRSVAPDLTVAEVESILERTASGGSAAAADPASGWGIVDAGAAVARAVVPEPVPPPAPEPPFPVGTVIRVGPTGIPTDPIVQSVAMSRFVFRLPVAEHAVIARVDDYPDALAGSSLAYGLGPLLFARPAGRLDQLVAAELVRTLQAGSTVYLLGGPRALPATLEDEIRSLGFTPRRLAGSTREETAAAVADEVRAVVRRTGAVDVPGVLLVTSRQWPDAVSAGSLGSWFGMPILVTPPDVLAPAAAAAIQRLAPAHLYVVGGPLAVSGQTAARAREHAPTAVFARLAGDDRVGTAVAVADEMVRLFRGVFGIDPLLAVGVNLRAEGAYAVALSATTALGNASGIFLPVEGDTGDVVPDATRRLACRVEPLQGIAAGGDDVLAETAKRLLNDHLERRGC